MAHHKLIAILVKSDRSLLWLNSAFLFWLASVPFPHGTAGGIILTSASPWFASVQ
jgi:hypothetical protein